MVFQCHMCNNVTYPILRHMLGYTDDQQLHHYCHLTTLASTVFVFVFVVVVVSTFFENVVNRDVVRS